MTMHQSAIDRMQKEGMVATAVEATRRAIEEAEEEIVESRIDIADQLARIHEDELYVAQQETRLEALRDRLKQLEAADAFSVIPPHKEVTT